MLIGTNLSTQTNKNIPQKINFTGKLVDDSATTFFITEKQYKTILNFFNFVFLNCDKNINI